MKRGYFTQTELVNLSLMNETMSLTSKRIKDIIESHIKSTERKAMKDGVNYYNGKHDILDYQPYYYLDGQKVYDKTKANHRLTHLFHKILVDQKASYIVGNPVVISMKENNRPISASEKTKQEDIVNATLGEYFSDKLNDWIVATSNQAVGWLHFYINGDGVLQFIIIDSTELIPVYDTEYQKELVGMIRYYEVEYIDENTGLSSNKYNVEWWTKDNVTYFTQTDSGDFVLDISYDPNPAGHFVQFNTLAPDAVNQKGWGKVPFVSLENNSQKKTDLEPIKSLIDAYDKVKSGWVNDLDDFQELVYVLKGYSALTSQTQKGLSDLAIFLQNLKTNKVISVEEGGGVDSLQSEIPIEAKEKFLEITRREIFYFGQGIDVGNDKFGNNPSGVSLKFLYASLDMKANTLIRKIKKSLTDLLYFVTEYLKMRENIIIDPTKFTYIFNKSIIFNEKEKVDMLKTSEGMISKQTIIENHPLVDNISEEQARLEKEEKEDIEKGITQLGLVPQPQRVA
ncbi:phage portal protein [Immundisolibacter sp.]